MLLQKALPREPGCRSRYAFLCCLCALHFDITVLPPFLRATLTSLATVGKSSKQCLLIGLLLLLQAGSTLTALASLRNGFKLCVQMSSATAFKPLSFLMQEGALTALASVADASKNYFINYYDHVMPLLRGILSSGVSREEALLRAKALECISLVGMAVGKERFREDAHRVMELIRQLQVNASPHSVAV